MAEAPVPNTTHEKDDDQSDDSFNSQTLTDNDEDNFTIKPTKEKRVKIDPNFVKPLTPTILQNHLNHCTTCLVNSPILTNTSGHDQ